MAFLQQELMFGYQSLLSTWLVLKKYYYYIYSYSYEYEIFWMNVYSYNVLWMYPSETNAPML